MTQLSLFISRGNGRAEGAPIALTHQTRRVMRHPELHQQRGTLRFCDKLAAPAARDLVVLR